MVMSWLGRPEIHKWLDFGDGRTLLSEGQFTFLVRNPANRVNLFCDTRTDAPVGVIALQGIRNAARYGLQWGLRGNFEAGGRLVSMHAIYCNLDLAFNELGLATVQAWCVASNRPSLMVTRRAGYREMGRMRQAHLMDGALHDRIILDITAEEWAEQCAARAAGAEQP